MPPALGTKKNEGRPFRHPPFPYSLTTTQPLGLVTLNGLGGGCEPRGNADIRYRHSQCHRCGKLWRKEVARHPARQRSGQFAVRRTWPATRSNLRPRPSNDHPTHCASNAPRQHLSLTRRRPTPIPGYWPCGMLAYSLPSFYEIITRPFASDKPLVCER